MLVRSPLRPLSVRVLRGWAAGLSLVVLGALAACGGGDDAATTPSAAPGGGAIGGAPVVTTPAPTTKPPTTKPPAPTKPAVKALTCTQVKNAKLGSPTVPFNGYPDYIPLADGVWAGEDGNSVQLMQCAIGDLDGNGAADAVASVVLNGGGTGHFYSIGVWRNVSGAPVFTALVDLGDRTPVETITVAGNRATVVYLTRTDDMPAAAVNLRRTAIYRLTGSALVEVSHTDVPYTP